MSDVICWPHSISVTRVGLQQILQIRRAVSLQCFVYQQNCFEDVTLGHWEAVQFLKEWRRMVPLPPTQNEFSSSILHFLEFTNKCCLWNSTEQAVILIKSGCNICMDDTSLLCGKVGAYFADRVQVVPCGLSSFYDLSFHCSRSVKDGTYVPHLFWLEDLVIAYNYILCHYLFHIAWGPNDDQFSFIIIQFEPILCHPRFDSCTALLDFILSTVFILTWYKWDINLYIICVAMKINTKRLDQWWKRCYIIFKEF